MDENNLRYWFSQLSGIIHIPNNTIVWENKDFILFFQDPHYYIGFRVKEGFYELMHNHYFRQNCIHIVNLSYTRHYMSIHVSNPYNRIYGTTKIMETGLYPKIPNTLKLSYIEQKLFNKKIFDNTDFIKMYANECIRTKSFTFDNEQTMERISKAKDIFDEAGLK